MDIKGFRASDGTVHKYDYNALVNIPGPIGNVTNGEDGATFTPSVTENGVLTWTNNKGLDNPDPVNIMGLSPHIGENGNWFIGNVDTGVHASGSGEGVSFTTDATLSLKNGVLSVNTAHEPDPDNTLPITSAAVANTIGNIEILLGTI